MNSVKRECGVELCRGCLSADRRLTPLANYDLFFTLLDDKQKFEALKSPVLLLCWECGARLHRVKLFQTQAQNAHRLLEEVADEMPIQGLSRLSISLKQDYDVIIKEELEFIEEPLEIPIQKEEMKVQIEELNLNLNQDDGHDFDDNYNFESHDQIDFVKETSDNYLQNETIDTSVKEPKRKLKIEKQNKTTIKRKRVETNTCFKNKSLRSGLRSSGETIPPLYPCNKNNGNQKYIKPNMKVNNTISRKIVKAKLKKLNKNKSQSIINVKKETKEPDYIAAEDLQNELLNNKAEANIDSDLGNAEIDDKNPEEKIDIQIGKTEQNDNLNEEDSQSDPEDDDPDYKEELIQEPEKKEKKKKKYVTTKNNRLSHVRVRFNIIEDLDEYFTNVNLSPEEIKNILENEVSYKNEQNPNECNYCGFRCKMSKTLVRHKRERHKQIAKCKNPVHLMYRCNICQKTVRKDHTEAHMMYLHRLRYYCKECDKVFWDEEEGNIHYRESHKDPRGYKCGLCAKVAKSTRSLEGHMRECHTPSACAVCGKVLSGPKYMQMHARRHDTDGSAPELRYCVSCDKQFLSVYLYHQHVKNTAIHTGLPPERFPCTACDKVLCNKFSLTHHYERFHGGATKYQCQHCDKYYARKSSLKLHTTTAHLKLKAPKNKLCSVCGRGFSFARTLMFHMRTHTGERPHACPHCPAAFAQPYPLRKHLATQHPGAPEARE